MFTSRNIHPLQIGREKTVISFFWTLLVGKREPSLLKAGLKAPRERTNFTLEEPGIESRRGKAKQVLLVDLLVVGMFIADVYQIHKTYDYQNTTIFLSLYLRRRVVLAPQIHVQKTHPLAIALTINLPP